MVNISTANILGGIGMLLILIGALLGGLPSLIGYVLLLVSFYQLSSALGLKTFRLVIIAIIVNIIAIITILNTRCYSYYSS